MGPQGNIGTQTMGENRPQRLEGAEPGVLFWDTIIRESIPDCYADLGFRTTSTNPCGEIPLCPYDSCRLLALNLYSYVLNPFTSEAHFDFDTFSRHAQMAQRIMDDIVDLELEKIDGIIAKIDSDPQAEDVKYAERRLWEKIKEKTAMGRRTGVGITAEGDMLAALGLRYGTQEATDFAVKVQRTLALNAYRASVTMAQERGRFCHLRRPARDGQPLHPAHQGGRRGPLRRHGALRPTQHRVLDHCSHGHHIADDADHEWHRTGLHARL